MKIIIDTKKYNKYCASCGRLYKSEYNYCPKCESDKPLYEVEFE